MVLDSLRAALRDCLREFESGDVLLQRADSRRVVVGVVFFRFRFCLKAIQLSEEVLDFGRKLLARDVFCCPSQRLADVREEIHVINAGGVLRLVHSRSRPQQCDCRDEDCAGEKRSHAGGASWVRRGCPRAACYLQLPRLDVAVDDLFDDAVGKFDGQFVGSDCRHGAVAEHRM